MSAQKARHCAPADLVSIPAPLHATVTWLVQKWLPVDAILKAPLGALLRWSSKLSKQLQMPFFFLALTVRDQYHDRGPARARCVAESPPASVRLS